MKDGGVRKTDLGSISMVDERKKVRGRRKEGEKVEHIKNQGLQ